MVRDREAPLITLVGLTSRITFALMPKGDTRRGELATQNHPAGVTGRGEKLKAGESFFQHAEGIFK